jgi:hypothetical protein
MNTQRIIRSVPLVNYCLIASDETTADEMVRYTLLCFVFMPGSITVGGLPPTFERKNREIK